MEINKQELVKEFQIHDKDSGSTEVQIAILTARIRHLTEHLRKHTRRGLLKLVGRRRKMLRYIKAKKPEVYLELINKLGLRG